MPLDPVSYDSGNGSKSLVVAITRTVQNLQGRLTHELWGFKELRGTPLTDPRLFQDASGSIWVVAFFPKLGGLQTVTRVSVKCKRRGGAVTFGGRGGVGSKRSGSKRGGSSSGRALSGWFSPRKRCNIRITGTRMLWHRPSALRWSFPPSGDPALALEQSWVPHNGTTRMSYSISPTSGPQNVFDWGSYNEPVPKLTFDSIAPPEPFFDNFNLTYGGLVEFAGSTPAILHHDGTSFIAVGQVRAHPRCFHDADGPGVATNCASLATSTGGTVPRVSHYNFTLPGGNGTYVHHKLEHAMFFYRFSATPPYAITHISHAVIPCSYHHYGIVYPSGLTRIGSNGDLLISYGEADRYSRILTITSANFDRLLTPIEGMRGAVQSYTLCTMPCPPATSSAHLESMLSLLSHMLHP